jgi:D-alanyl-D-alanine carboxypeptidase
MKKIQRIITLLIICALLMGIRPKSFALEDPELRSTDAMILMDLDTGNVLFEKNRDMHHSIASLTKVMTCLLAVEAVEKGQVTLEEKVTAGEDCHNGLEADSSTSGIQAGEIMTFKDLLYCAMVQSANEACNIIGTRVAGSIDAFVELMNQRAVELGCTETHFMDPNGLTNRDGNHYSTPNELTLIVREAISHPLFMEICNTAEYQVEATNVREGFTITNSNALISAGSIYGNQYLYEGAAGVKTGFTKPAGYCLISTCERDGIRLLAIVLGCNGDQTYTHADEYENFVDTRSLYNWAFSNFEYRNVLTAGEARKQISVMHAKNDEQAVLRPEKDVRLLLPKDINDEDIVIDDKVTNLNPLAPMDAGTELGTAVVYVRGEEVARVRLINNTDIPAQRGIYFKESLKRIFSAGWVKTVVIIMILAVAVYFLLLYRYRKIKRKHKLERQRAEAKRKEVEARRRAEEKAEQELSGERTRYYRTAETEKINPEARNMEQQDIDEIIRSLGLDK